MARWASAKTNCYAQRYEISVAQIYKTTILHNSEWQCLVRALNSKSCLDIVETGRSRWLVRIWVHSCISRQHQQKETKPQGKNLSTGCKELLLNRRKWGKVSSSILFNKVNRIFGCNVTEVAHNRLFHDMNHALSNVLPVYRGRLVTIHRISWTRQQEQDISDLNLEWP